MSEEADSRHLTLLMTAEFQFDDRFASRGVVSTIGSESTPLDSYLRLAREVEDEGFDGVLSADFLGINRKTLNGNGDGPYTIRLFEPLTRLAALAVSTRRLGLVVTLSTQFSQPYSLARQLTSLDHLSGGRAAWNVVTSFTGERNFGLKELPSPSERYERAQEFLDVVGALWNSWAPDYAVTRSDGSRGVDVDKIVDIRHEGKHFSVEQALDLPPSPQRVPVIVQAGSSGLGVELAGRNAEVIYVATPDLESAVDYSDQLAASALAAGRERSHIRVLPGTRIYLGETHEEAVADYLSVLSERDLIAAKQSIRGELPDLDIEDLGLDDELPLDRFPSEEEIRSGGRRISRSLIYRNLAASGQYRTVREFLTRFATSFGHSQFIGTPEAVADEIERWFRSGAVDGFTIHSVNSWRLLVDRLLPLLRERDVLLPRPAADAPIQTFRERLGTTPAPRLTHGFATVR